MRPSSLLLKSLVAAGISGVVLRSQHLLMMAARCTLQAEQWESEAGMNLPTGWQRMTTMPTTSPPA